MCETSSRASLPNTLETQCRHTKGQRDNLRVLIFKPIEQSSGHVPHKQLVFPGVKWFPHHLARIFSLEVLCLLYRKTLSFSYHFVPLLLLKVLALSLIEIVLGSVSVLCLFSVQSSPG